MKLVNELEQKYTIIHMKDWEKSSYIYEYDHLFDKVGIIFLQDDTGTIVGAITKKGQKQYIDCGTIDIKSIYSSNSTFDDYSIWFVREENTNLGWITREALYRYLYRQYQSVIHSIPFKLRVIDEDEKMMIDTEEFQSSKNEEKIVKLVTHEQEEDVTSAVKKTKSNVVDKKERVMIETKVHQGGKSVGAMQIELYANDIEKIAKQLDSFTNLDIDLKAVFNSSFDIIAVSDEKGNILRVSSSCEKLWGQKEEMYLGRNVRELEEEGVFRPSLIRLVLEKKEKMQIIQTTKTGRKLMVLGTPIKDKQGNIIRVVNISRDITEEEKLEMELEDTKVLLEGYKKEIQDLRKLYMEDEKYIFKSDKMRVILQLLHKLGQVDSTVLITGESGVGKEVIASYIHENSSRKGKPFITVNCGAIPENLIESELFGYEKGSFTGASKSGKVGLFEMAHEGTLFLDEIGEISPQLQVKLLRVIQESKFMRVGGTKPIEVDVRVIAATNRDIQQEVKKGNFREDLYYRLNVVPIYVPPIRERKEDISHLITYFLKKINRRYKSNKSFTKEVLHCFHDYHWPGNVRELQNIVERLVVTVGEDTIEIHHLPNFLVIGEEATNEVNVIGLMPLKDAMDMLEEQLILKAKKKYRTTTKIAEVLKVNQSTISRKLKKYER
ncbi:sigma-54 interaction domain-containing protein [Anaerobacillus sp. MEB173]|uniref:sigma-54 interaction domain-containing protein n=1 Tax=Anaerobacillus sp. MEB173 TaxID=3383345 RepID=UPI003F93A6EA